MINEILIGLGLGGVMLVIYLLLSLLGMYISYWIIKKWGWIGALIFIITMLMLTFVLNIIGGQ